jgi:hypothetical protein
MAAKLNRDEILCGLLQTLVDGWGYNAVRDSLHDLKTPLNNKRATSGTLEKTGEEGAAVRFVEEMAVPPERKRLLLDLATRFDDGSAFPKLSDVRAFLISHQHNARELKGRSQAFKRMLLVLAGMSEKGLEKVISRSHHSGPAELEAISNAIRGAGEDLRGAHRVQEAPASSEAIDLAKDAPPSTK